jgi:hypothetical protein
VYIGKFSGQKQMNDNWGKQHKWNNGHRFTAYGITFYMRIVSLKKVTQRKVAGENTSLTCYTAEYIYQFISGANK